MYLRTIYMKSFVHHSSKLIIIIIIWLILLHFWFALPANTLLKAMDLSVVKGSSLTPRSLQQVVGSLLIPTASPRSSRTRQRTSTGRLQFSEGGKYGYATQRWHHWPHIQWVFRFNPTVTSLTPHTVSLQVQPNGDIIHPTQWVFRFNPTVTSLTSHTVSLQVRVNSPTHTNPRSYQLHLFCCERGAAGCRKQNKLTLTFWLGSD